MQEYFVSNIEMVSELKTGLNFFNNHTGYPLNFIFAFHGYIKGAYLCLAEVKWVKTGVPGVKPLLGVKGWGPSTWIPQ